MTTPDSWMELVDLRKMLHLAPFHRWLGLDIVDLTEAELILEMPWRDEIVSNPTIGSAHGGILSALIDLTGLYAINALGARHRQPPICMSIFTALQPPVHSAQRAVWSSSASSSASRKPGSRMRRSDWSPAAGAPMSVDQRFLLAFGLVLALAGCVAVPDSGTRPAVLTFDSIDTTQTLAARGNMGWPPDQWWRLAGDPQLTLLIEKGLANSPQVAVVLARIRRAEAEVQRVGAARLPTVTGEAEGGLRRQSGNNGIPAQFLPDGWRDYGQASLAFGFDLELWGRNRAAHAAATSEAHAAVVDAAQARLVLSVAITAAYSELGRHYRERDNAEAVLANRRAALDLAALRERNGLDNRIALRRAEAELASAEQDLAAVNETIGLRRNQLAALMGAGPDRGLTIARPPLAVSTPLGLPAGVTTELLGRRPDVVAARERVEAAASRIKVARAGFFPSINLRALIGLQALGLGNLVDSGSLTGTVGPAISLPIFQGGALKAQYGRAGAEYDETVASYNQTVISAFQQVADAVTQREAAEGRLAAARSALKASEDALALVRNRNMAGLASRLDVLASERSVHDLRLAVIGLETYDRGATLALIRALGGGFAANLQTSPEPITP